jgi:hypothetical protein
MTGDNSRDGALIGDNFAVVEAQAILFGTRYGHGGLYGVS